MPKGGARPGAGRPKGVPNKTTAELKAYAAQFSQEAIDTAVALMRSAESEATRIAAASVVLDRAHGKPRQELEHTGADGGPIQSAAVDVSGLSVDQLRTLASIKVPT